MEVFLWLMRALFLGIVLGYGMWFVGYRRSHDDVRAEALLRTGAAPMDPLRKLGARVALGSAVGIIIFAVLYAVT